MNARELHALAPLGAYVRFSDGTAQPNARFNRKLRKWKSSNNAGHFVKAHIGDPNKEYDRDHFTIQTENGEVVVVNRIFDVDSTLDFEIQAPRLPGMILAYSDYDRDELEIRHVWLNEAEARE